MASWRLTRLGASVLLSLVLTAGLTSAAFGASPTNPTPGPSAAPTVAATSNPTTGSVPADCLPSGWNPKISWPDCLLPEGPSTNTNAAQVGPATPSFAISGTVYQPGGATPLAGIAVEAASSTNFASTATDVSGNYSVNVPAGDYTMFFDDGAATYLHGYYDSGVAGHFTIVPGSSTLVTVIAAPVSLLNVWMQTGVYVQGTVTGPGPTPLQNIGVRAQSSNYNGFALTDSSGNYSVLVPASSTDTLYFTDQTGTYLAGYYSSGGSGHFTLDFGSATALAVGAGVTGVDVQMIAAPPWSVTLATSATNVPLGTVVTLTATASEDVGPTSYWIVILTHDGTVVKSCGNGTACVQTVSGPAAETYHAVVGSSIGTSPIVTSAPVSVTWMACGTYVPITPARVLDTRNGTGLSGQLLANTPATFGVTGTHVPANAIAVTGNVTVVNSSNSWAVYLGPDPVASPTTSTINFATGQITGNGLTVALSGTGTLSATYMSTAGNKTDLVFDVTGYFLPDLSGATYHALATPARMLDTRVGKGLSSKLLANTPATFPVAGVGGSGIPSTATAVTGNVTVVNPSFSWAVYLGPIATATPTTSTINFNTGEVKGNSLTVQLGAGGTLSATFMSSAGNTTDLVFDVTGYYTADSTGAVFMPIAPSRLLDTRVGNGLSAKLVANTPATFQVTGRGSVLSTAIAVTGNVTVVNETFSWAVFLGPVPAATPSTSTINFNAGDIKGNGLTVALGAGGTLSATYMSSAGNTTDLVFDVTGFYVSEM